MKLLEIILLTLILLVTIILALIFNVNLKVTQIATYLQITPIEIIE
jgi:hypothetical protein